MKPSEVLILAAERVHDGLDIGGCDAARAATAGDDAAYKMVERYIWETYYGDYRGPSNYERDYEWGVLPWAVYFWGKAARSPERVIGLCLAAAVAESEGC